MYYKINICLFCKDKTKRSSSFSSIIIFFGLYASKIISKPSLNPSIFIITILSLANLKVNLSNNFQLKKNKILNTLLHLLRK